MSSLAPAMKRCVICEQNVSTYAFTIRKHKFLQCDHCRTLALEKNNTHYSVQGLDRDSDALGKLVLEAIEYRAAKAPFLVLSSLNKDPLVDYVKPHLPLSTAYMNITDLLSEPYERFGAIFLLTPLSLIPDVNCFFQKLRALLESDGVFIFLQPMLDSSQARLMGRNWLEWDQPHQFYLTRDTLHMMMLKQGFNRGWFHKARYPYTLEYICRRLNFSKFSRLLPSIIRKLKFRMPSSHIVASCQLAALSETPTLSIIIPVFNEKNTFEEMIQMLLAKEIVGLKKQIIIIESHSTDGTREVVQKYSNHQDVQVIWQEEAQGKGFAVREGLAAATGDYVLIQDADLEYDINDYESLLAPLRTNQVMFVLGSRHSGNWRIREFSDAMATAMLFNLGHLFFTWFINLLTRQRMADPFTMFKVFRRDALFGLNFTCKRFDFDHEMVIKLVRKGYQPLELPVNYRARSFSEGKKVSFTKDGLTWVYTDIKLRFGRLGKWSN